MLDNKPKLSQILLTLLLLIISARNLYAEPPFISQIDYLKILEDTQSDPIPLTLSDSDADLLTLTLTTSNAKIIPITNIYINNKAFVNPNPYTIIQTGYRLSDAIHLLQLLSGMDNNDTNAENNKISIDMNRINYLFERVTFSDVLTVLNALSTNIDLISNKLTLTVIPIINQYGDTTITINAFDSQGTRSKMSFTVTVLPVNDKPEFIVPDNRLITVFEDTETSTYSRWAQDISAGPNEEQTIKFIVDTTNNGLFQTPPAISTEGVLTFTPAQDEYGQCTVTVMLQDDGGTENSGFNTSNTESFVIHILPVNDPPSFSKGADQVVAEDCGKKTVPGWATNLSSGPENENTQSVHFVISTSDDSLFTELPDITPDGTLTYLPKKDQNGLCTISVTLYDDGGTENGGKNYSNTETFTINIKPVNDPPSFKKGPDRNVLEDDPKETFERWATEVSSGPENENTQSVHFVISTSDDSLFTELPDITPNGTLTYLPKKDQYGFCTISITLYDDGGTENGGKDSYTETFTINIEPVNDPPSFNKGPDQNVLEDCGKQTVPGWATNVSSGPENENTQTVHFVVSTNNDSLFKELPGINPDGTLTYLPKKDQNGLCTISVTLYDDGGTENGGKDYSNKEAFTIYIKPVNDPPDFSIPNYYKTRDYVEEDIILENWVTSITAGPPDEPSDFLQFTITNLNQFSFEKQPEIIIFEDKGHLIFKPQNNLGGVARFEVVLDDGADENQLSSTRSFSIEVEKKQGTKEPGKEESTCFISTVSALYSNTNIFLIPILLSCFIALANKQKKLIISIFFCSLFVFPILVKAESANHYSFGFQYSFMNDLTGNKNIEDEFKKDIDIKCTGNSYQFIINTPKKEFFPNEYVLGFGALKDSKDSGDISYDSQYIFGFRYKKSVYKRLSFSYGCDITISEIIIPYNKMPPVKKNFIGTILNMGIAYIHPIKNYPDIFIKVSPFLACENIKSPAIDRLGIQIKIGFSTTPHQIKKMITNIGSFVLKDNQGVEFTDNTHPETAKQFIALTPTQAHTVTSTVTAPSDKSQKTTWPPSISPSVVLIESTEYDPNEISLSAVKKGLINYLTSIEWNRKRSETHYLIRIARSYGETYDFLDTIEQINNIVLAPEETTIHKQILKAVNYLKTIPSQQKKQIIFIISESSSYSAPDKWDKYIDLFQFDKRNIQFNCIITDKQGGSSLKELTEISQPKGYFEYCSYDASCIEKKVKAIVEGSMKDL